jgi:uncharacterized protein (DUF2164 family)
MVAFQTEQVDLTMPITLSAETTNVALASIERYFSENMDEQIGSLQAGSLLAFFLKEIGPAVYNKAVADAQARLQERVAELDVDVYEEEFAYWAKARPGTRPR